MSTDESQDIYPDGNAKDLVRLQDDILKRVQNTVRNYKKDSADRHTKIYFETRLTRLEELKMNFHQNHRRLVLNPPPTSKMYFSEDIADKFEEESLHAVSIITEAYQAKFPPEAVNTKISLTTTEPAPNQAIRNAARLPKLIIPSFSGKYTDWPSFHDSFLRLVHTNSSLADIEKFHYLKQSLPDNFDSDIRDIPLTSDKYPEAWKILVTRYNNSRVLFTHYMNLLSSQSSIQKENASSIKHLLDTSRSCVNALQNLKVHIDQCSEIVVHFLVAKLPRETHQLWEQELGNSLSIPTFQQFAKFLEVRYRILEAIEFQHNIKAPSHADPMKTSTSLHSKALSKALHRDHKINHMTNSKTNFVTECPECRGAHIIRRCPAFLAMDSFERKSVVDRSKLCINCLSATHTVSACLSSKNCQQCGKRHHTLIHFPQDQSSQPVNSASSSNLTAKSKSFTPSSSTSAKGSMIHHVAPSHDLAMLKHAPNFTSRAEVLLPTALINVITSTKQPFILRALIDQGSTGALISERAVQSLKLNRISSISSISLANGQRTYGNHVTSITLQSLTDDQYELSVVATIVKTVTANLPSRHIKHHSWFHVHGLQLADPEFYRSSTIDLLLGADVLGKILMSGIRRGGPNEPVAQQTRLGWVVFGETFETSIEPKLASSINHAQVSLQQLDTLVKQFYTLESVPTERRYTPEDKWCEEFFQHTHTRQPNGKYTVRLPFKSILHPNLVLGKSKQIALNRFHSSERKLSRDPNLQEQYCAAIQEYFDLRQITPVETIEEQHRQFNCGKTPSYTCCTLPHHAVIKGDSLTTKCRVVFDASAGTSSGQSLNDLLCKGPTLQNDLAAILLNWRLHEFVVTADVEKMYRCIDMHQEDSEYQRILWRNQLGQIQEFRLTTVTFGTTSAPYTAIRVIHQLAEDEAEKYPLARNVLMKEMYVDDIFMGGGCIDHVMDVRNQTQHALKTAGFKLHKWAANNSTLLKGIPLEHQSSATALQVNSDELIKTLGMYWQPCNDTFHYQLNFDLPLKRITKRSVLSTIAKLFDPLGLINPVIVAAKIFLKHLWTINLEWDTELSPDLCDEWGRIVTDLPAVNKIQFPRWLQFSPTTNKQFEIHAFCDGSTKAYASIVYLRVQTGRKDFCTNIIAAKSKVTPKPTICIPRVELCAAVLSVKLVNWVLTHLSLPTKPISVYYWTDSTIVLCWIRGDVNRWPVFVANRIGLIHADSNVDQWHHISTNENPADHSSRGLSAAELRHCELYWHGPAWLNKMKDSWPCSDWTFLNETAAEQAVNVIVTQQETKFLHQFSSFSHLRRIMAWLLRFKQNCMVTKEQRTSGPLTVGELHISLQKLVRMVQAECFAKEIRSLKNGEAVSSKSQLLNLTPFIDNDEILRVGGRLQRSLLSYDEKHPMILPKVHHFTNLVIENSHITTLHGGIQLTSAFIRKRFWILTATKVIRSKLRGCVRCFRLRPKICQQLMGNLPTARVTPSQRPFLSTGIDYTGAIELKAARYRGCTKYKGYIAIFICLATKAIHLEAVTGMTTDQFLCALHRFIGRRGLCLDIYSDCGTNFIGADKILKTNSYKFVESMERHVIPQLAEQGIQWHFNPPLSPNFGGLWEANIKSVKRHLKGTISDTLTYEDLSTVLVRIEACLNSRPLCPLSSCPDDLSALTPGHFLIGEALLAPPEPACPERSLHRQYLSMHRMSQHFWSRWSKEWLSHLQSRPKWCRKQDNLKTNDLVLLKDDRLPPQQWLLGRITATTPGRDGCVRVVTVRTQDGSYQRSVSKICRLPIDEARQIHQ